MAMVAYKRKQSIVCLWFQRVRVHGYQGREHAQVGRHDKHAAGEVAGSLYLISKHEGEKEDASSIKTIPPNPSQTIPQLDQVVKLLSLWGHSCSNQSDMNKITAQV